MMDPETPVGQIVWACGSTGATANPHEVNVELCLACFNAAMDAAKCEAEGRAALAQGNLDQLRMTRDEEIARLRAKVDEWRSRYEAACLDRDVAEAKVAGDWPNALVEAQRDRAESAEARVAELEAAAWELFQAFDGTDVALQARMLDNLRALLAPREPKSCGKCGGSGYVRDTGPDGEPAGDYCPECRGGEDGR